MIVLNFIIGLIVIATPFLAMYGIGRFLTERTADFSEILIAGLLGITLIVLAGLLVMAMYTVGAAVVSKLFLMS